MKEWPFLSGIVVFLFISYFEHDLLHGYGILVLVGLFIVIINSALSVAHHAEDLAHKLGEPWGTLILTIAAVTVEVVIITMMMLNGAEKTIVRDTIVYAIILDISGILGLSTILGGKKHNIQGFNQNSTNSYIIVIIAAIFFSMIVPGLIKVEDRGIYSIFDLVMIFIFGIVFYKTMLKDNKNFFTYKEKVLSNNDAKIINNLYEKQEINIFYSSLFLVLNIVLIGMLSEVLAVFLEPQIVTYNLPVGLVALVVAIISGSPELITAVKSALNNRLQTPVNIAFGASLATILFTVFVLKIFMLLGFFEFSLILTNMQIIILGVLFLISILIYNDEKSNELEGWILFSILPLTAFLMWFGYM
jgi:Ca2+:H+ antiporter